MFYSLNRSSRTIAPDAGTFRTETEKHQCRLSNSLAFRWLMKESVPQHCSTTWVDVTISTWTNSTRLSIWRPDPSKLDRHRDGLRDGTGIGLQHRSDLRVLIVPAALLLPDGHALRAGRALGLLAGRLSAGTPMPAQPSKAKMPFATPYPVKPAPSASAAQPAEPAQLGETLFGQLALVDILHRLLVSYSPGPKHER
jgi:hypothetical protein